MTNTASKTSTQTGADALAIPCPTCRAEAGKPCRTFRRRRGMCGRGFGAGFPTATHAARLADAGARAQVQQSL